MQSRVFIGAIAAFSYNRCVGCFPSYYLRHAFLRAYLKRLAPGTNVQSRCHFLNGRRISIGPRNVINFGCLFDGRKYGIITGSDVSIGPEAAILTLGHDPQSGVFADQGGDVKIGDRAWIAYRAVIMPGVTVGDGAVVAAGSVVTKDVAPFTVVAGVPAKMIRKRNEDLVYQLDFRPLLG